MQVFANIITATAFAVRLWKDQVIQNDQENMQDQEKVINLWAVSNFSGILRAQIRRVSISFQCFVAMTQNELMKRSLHGTQQAIECLASNSSVWLGLHWRLFRHKGQCTGYAVQYIILKINCAILNSFKESIAYESCNERI